MNGAKNFYINKKKNNWFKILIGTIVLLFCLWVLNFFVAPIKNIFYNLSSPIQKTFWSAGVSSSSFFGSLFNGVSLFRENENLKQENQKLLSQIVALQSITQENQAKSDVLTVCQNNGFSLVMVGISGLDNDNLSINKGSADGISEGMPVINQQGVLFGKISKVYKNFSHVILISNKNSITNVKVQQADNMMSEVNGVVKGKGALTAYLDLIPISSEINYGDILVTSAIDKSFPKDLLVGKITKKEKNDQNPFQQAEINLFFNVTASDNLFVITDYKK